MDEKDQYYIQLYVYAGVLIAAAIYLLFKSIYETGLIQYLAKKIKAIFGKKSTWRTIDDERWTIDGWFKAVGNKPSVLEII